MGKRHRDETSEASDDSDASLSDSGRSGHRSHKAHDHKREIKKKKSKHKKKHKTDSEKELLKAAKKFLKKQLAGQDEVASQQPENQLEHDPPPQKIDKQISSEDYFLKHTEFTTWLRESRNLYFTDLTAEVSREHFDDFVEAWNEGRLAGKYYSGIMAAPISRTSYKWKFAGGSEGPSGVGMSAYLDDEAARKHQDHLDSRAELKADRRKWNADQRVALDELLPKATGRDALVEKKMARREATRAREDSPDAVPLPGGGRDIMGGGDSFEAARAREAKRMQMRQHRALAKAEETQLRVAQYQAAEDAKMAQFKALVAAGPISIPKRQPPSA